MSRYASSFIITTLLYGTLVMGSIYALFDTKVIQANKDESNKIKFAFVREKQEPIIQKEVVIKKPQPPKKVEQKVKKKLEKKIVKKEVQKPEPQKKIVEEKVLVEKETKEFKQEEQVLKEQPLKEEVAQVKTDNKQAQVEMLLALKELIEKNKSYPAFARKANIQGSVKVCFTISKEGKLVSLMIKEGKKVFHNSALNAIKRSLPYPVQEGVLTSSLTIDLEIVYTLI